MQITTRTVCVAVLLLLGRTTLAQDARTDSPLSPGDAVAIFQTEPGLRVELAAAEPEIVDPVAMAFDARGRLLVVEGRGYPVDAGRGVVALLDDPDGDGRFERRADYATGLRFPNGLLPWKGGVFVTDAPELLYLEDTDGDGRADSREVVLTGFATDRSTQLRVNDPTLGLDGWIYLAGGLSGGSVTSPRHPGRAAADLKRKDLRFHPYTGAFETVDGKSQFGIAFDDFGRRFLCTNRVQVQHVVMSSRSLARNPGLAFSATVQDLPEERIDDLLRGHNAAARIYPISDNLTTADSHAGTFSAACAVTVWRGGALPERYRGQAFSCDPTGNLIHRDELVPSGATFRARRAPDRTEFLASPDNWFRPVFLATGPDGALYVCDMYRKVIEHPDYIPKEVRKRTDFRSGENRGRIYRIVAHEKRRETHVIPATVTSAELARSLESDSSWHRDTAFRLLSERAAAGALPALRRVLAAGRNESAQVMAAHLLNRLGELAASDLLSLSQSRQAGVRDVALQLASPRLGDDRRLADRTLALAADPDARVRFRSALALGELQPTKTVDAALADIARRGAADRWTRAAVISSAPGRELALLEHLIATRRAPDDLGFSTLLHDLARAAGRAANLEKLRGTIFRGLDRHFGESEVWPFALLTGLARGGIGLDGFARDGSERSRFDTLATGAARMATDSEAVLEARVAAVEFLGHAAPSGQSATLAALVDPSRPRDLQRAAVRALARAKQGTAAVLNALDRWASYPAGVREVILESFLPRQEFATRLVAAVASGSVPAASISLDARQRLLKHANEGIRERAGRLFAAAFKGRMKIFEKHRAALSLSGDPQSGRAVFRELCSPCHRLDREGVHLGPDLFSIRNQTKETILLHIVVPNREFTPGFEATVVVTKRGQALTGLFTSETPTSITIRQNGGIEQTLLQGEVLSTTVSPVSLMPEGLEASTTLQGMADLLSYLKGEG